MKRNLLFAFFATCLCVGAYAQSVKGKVIDEFGLPLPGATVRVTEKENFGTVTDANGEYILRIEDGTYTLEISFIGYQTMTKEVVVSGNTTLDFDLTPGVLMGDEVIVLGDRLKGQAKALNQQRTNDNITNVIASDQIGRFPDANMGEALKRVQGITMQVDQGEARNIIIRGLAPQLNSVAVNGNRIPSAEGDNRNIQMDLIPSDMIQSVQVNKAITPEMDADAIGGSVNLVTRSAPDGFRVSGSLAGSSAPNVGDGMGYNSSFIIGKRLGNLGVIFSSSYRTDKIGSHDIEAAWDNEVEDANTGDDIEVDPYVSETDVRLYEIQRTRRSASLNLDYKVNENHTLFAKTMYNWRDDWENRFRITTEIETADFGNGLASAPTQWNAIASKQTKGGVNSDRVDNRRLEDQRVRFGSLGGQHIFNGLELRWNTSYSKASEERPDERYVVFETGDTFVADMDVSDPRFPYLSILDEATDGDFEFDKFEREFQYTEEEEITGQVDLKLPISAFNQKGAIKVGGKIRIKEKIRTNDFYEPEYFSLPADVEFLNGSGLSTVNKTIPDFMPGSQYRIGSIISANYLGGLNFDDSDTFDPNNQPSEYLAVNYNAKEDITAGYVQWDQQLTGKLKFVAGVRVENTSFDYTGNEVLDEENFVTEVTGSDSYTNVLPGFHLKYNVSDDFIIRAARTNSLARPNYYNLVPYRDDRESDGELFLGNPNLDPTTASNLDLMGELYFESVGIVSVGAFHKEIDNFIYTAASEETINAVDYEVFQPQNTGKGSVSGIEIGVQRQLDFLPGIWKGFGIYMNYTYNSSSVTGIANEDGDARNDIDLPNTADHLFNASLSFETKKLVVRASLNYSSDYLDEVGGNAFEDRYYDEQLFIDVNASYAFTDQWRFFAEANNLTNQPLRYYQGVQSRTMQAEYYGPKFNFGVKFDVFNK